MSPQGARIQVKSRRRRRSIEPVDRIDKTVTRTVWRTIHEPTTFKCCELSWTISPKRVLERAGLEPFSGISDPSIEEHIGEIGSRPGKTLSVSPIAGGLLIGWV